MNPEISLMLETWEIVRDYVPAKERVAVAEEIVRKFDEHLIDVIEAEHEMNEFDGALKAAVISFYDLGYEDGNEDDD